MKFGLLFFVFCSITHLPMLFCVNGYATIKPFSATKKEFESGNILILNKNTIMVTNILLNGKHNLRFWGGKGIPNKSGIVLDIIPNLNQSKLDFIPKNVYLKIPQPKTIYDIDYIALWDMESSQPVAVTKVDIKNSTSIDPDTNNLLRTMDGRPIARYPTCCPQGEMVTVEGCVKHDPSLKIKHVDIYELKEDCLEDEPLKNVIYEPYFYKCCSNQMYQLDSEGGDQYYLTQDAYLLINGSAPEITKEYCIGVVEEENELIETAFKCFDANEYDISANLNVLYACFIYISVFFLIITVFIFTFIKEASQLRGINIIGYTLCMAASFTILATARVLHVEGTVCNILGYIYQYCLVSSFTWLFFLTLDIFRRVWGYKTDRQNAKLFRIIYIVFSILIIPMLGLFISFLFDMMIPNQTLTANDSFYQPCWFRSKKKWFFYYLPIITSILLNIFFSFCTWLLMKKADKTGDAIWLYVRDEYKNIFRSCYLILIVMTICWAGEISSFFMDSKAGFWIAIDIIDSLQGVFIFIVFVCHDPVIRILKNRFCVKAESMCNNNRQYEMDGLTENESRDNHIT